MVLELSYGIIWRKAKFTYRLRKYGGWETGCLPTAIGNGRLLPFPNPHHGTCTIQPPEESCEQQEPLEERALGAPCASSRLLASGSGGLGNQVAFWTPVQVKLLPEGVGPAILQP